MRLLEPDAFAPIFEPLAREHVGIVDAGGNAGDAMIRAATRQLCDAFDVSWSTWKGERSGFDALLVFGGGNMGGGEAYAGGRRIREDALATGLPCDLLPQSFQGPDDVDGYRRVFVRESLSLEHCPNATLAPDLALGFDFRRPTSPAVTGREWFLRIDGESVFPQYPPHDPTRYAKSPAAYIAAARRVLHVVTDRLHFAIAALMAGRRATLLPCSYHKNRGMWEAWLRDLGCEWSEQPEIT